ncbi:MAG: hypothetical protein JSR45_03730 [Proteobacteria bacterium]|nr:hypothetical protein [Pseudomonadota bacterium]
MSATRRPAALIGMAACLAAALPSTVGTAAPASTSSASGACSVSVVNSQVQTVQTGSCGVSQAQLKRIEARLNALARDSKVSKEVLDQLVASTNQFLQASSVLAGLDERNKKQDEKLDRMLQLLEQGGASGRPAAVAGEVRSLAQETLDQTEQRIGQVRISLTRIESSYGHVTFYFRALNEGRTDTRLMLFGGGSFGNGGSDMVVQGERILASGIVVGGDARPNFVNVTLIPGVPLNGRVDFNGVHADPEEIQVFELAYSNSNLRPAGRAQFHIGG